MVYIVISRERHEKSLQIHKLQKLSVSKKRSSEPRLLLMRGILLLIIRVDSKDLDPFAVVEVSLTIREGALEELVDLRGTHVQIHRELLE